MAMRSHTCASRKRQGAQGFHYTRGIEHWATIQRPTDERYHDQEELEDKIAVLLGGRAAEHVVFDHFSTGAADDLAKADIARSMVTRYGMDRELGHVAYDRERALPCSKQPSGRILERNYSEATAQQIVLNCSSHHR